MSDALPVPDAQVARERPRWVAVTVFALVVSLVCLLLARWQWDRLQSREERNAAIISRYDLDPRPVGDLLEPGRPGAALPADAEWTPATATGRYGAEDVLVRKRSFNEATGYWVMTPLRTSDAAVLWVVRGWIPAGADARTPSAVPPAPTGTVTVTGHLRPGEGPSNDAGLPTGQVQGIDLDALAQRVDDPSYGAWLQADTESPAPDAAPQRLGPPDVGEGPHFGYAVQWVVFAIGAWVGWWVLLKRSREDDDEFDSVGDGRDEGV